MNIFLPESDHIINPDGSVYHLKLKPGEVARKIVTVGDPERVDQVSGYFDLIEISRQNREFKTVTGWLDGQRLTVISTGIGTDNIDIVLTELDSLFNVDFINRTPQTKFTPLQFFRLGTSGSIHDTIAMDTCLISAYAYGLDCLAAYYPVNKALNQSENALNIEDVPSYASGADDKLLQYFRPHFTEGVTLTIPGFYHPQGRQTRIQNEKLHRVRKLFNCSSPLGNLTNMEMETAGIYLLSEFYGHQAISLNAILANRLHQTYSAHPEKTIAKMIQQSLEIIVSIPDVDIS